MLYFDMFFGKRRILLPFSHSARRLHRFSLLSIDPATASRFRPKPKRVALSH